MSDSVKSCNGILRLTQRMLADFRQFLCARRAKIPGNLQLFRATSAEDLRDLGASLEALCLSTHCRLGEELERNSGVCATYAGRVHAYFVRAVRRNSGNFANFFARFRRKVCVISTPDARLFGLGQRTHDLVKSYEDAMRVAAQAGRVHAIFCARGAPKIFRNFAILSRDFGAQCA